MESVSDILGGSQLLLHLEVDPQLFFESYLSEEHRTFLHILRTIEEDSPLKDDQPIGGRGRPKFGNTSMMRFFLAKSLFRIDADKDMVKRLQADSSLKQIWPGRTEQFPALTLHRSSTCAINTSGSS